MLPRWVKCPDVETDIETRQSMPHSCQPKCDWAFNRNEYPPYDRETTTCFIFWSYERRLWIGMDNTKVIQSMKFTDCELCACQTLIAAQIATELLYGGGRGTNEE